MNCKGEVEDAMTTVWMKLCSSTRGKLMSGSTSAVVVLHRAAVTVPGPIHDVAGWENWGCFDMTQLPQQKVHSAKPRSYSTYHYDTNHGS